MHLLSCIISNQYYLRYCKLLQRMVHRQHDRNVKQGKIYNITGEQVFRLGNLAIKGETPIYSQLSMGEKLVCSNFSGAKN